MVTFSEVYVFSFNLGGVVFLIHKLHDSNFILLFQFQVYHFFYCNVYVKHGMLIVQVG